jgi:uncharacterized protein (DUF2147 family)
MEASMPVASLIAAMLLAGQPPVAAPAPGSIRGKWLTDDKKAVVTIGPCGALLCGWISKVLDTTPGVPETDVNNPDPDLRSRAITGLPVLSGFRRKGAQWTGGHAYDPKSGRSYRSTLELNRDGSLKVTGCVLFFCQSKRWTRKT